MGIPHLDHRAVPPGVLGVLGVAVSLAEGWHDPPSCFPALHPAFVHPFPFVRFEEQTSSAHLVLEGEDLGDLRRYFVDQGPGIRYDYFP